MPTDTRIDRSRGLRTHRVTGELSLEAVLRTLGDVYADPEHDPDMDVLWDLREARVRRFSTRDVEDLRDFVSRHWGTGGRGRAALVVSNDLQYGMSRMYEMLSQGTTRGQIRVFRDMREARNWLSGREGETG
jgi:hypothetical protein